MPATTTNQTNPTGVPAPRFDNFTSVHKAIRALLFDLASTAARTDLADEPAAAGLVRRFEKAIGMLKEHAAHEDREVLPRLHRIDPALECRIASDHESLEALNAEVEAIVAEIADASAEVRASRAPLLCRATNRLVAAQLAHMNREETEVTSALQAAFTDQELMAIHGRIVGSIPPARLQSWMELILAAATPTERAALQARAKAN